MNAPQVQFASEATVLLIDALKDNIASVTSAWKVSVIWGHRSRVLMLACLALTVAQLSKVRLQKTVDATLTQVPRPVLGG
jgi:hypothetical protein